MTEEQLKMIEARCDGVETEVEEWYRVKELIALARWAIVNAKPALEKIKSCELSVNVLRHQTFKDAYINMADETAKECLASYPEATAAKEEVKQDLDADTLLLLALDPPKLGEL